jgi:hypothetical protein
MQSVTSTVSKRTLWIGRIVTSILILFLLFDGVMKLVKPAVVVEGTVRLGYPEYTIVPIGIVLLISTIFYAIPRTSVLGAILLTGYLGGAVATHVRVGGTAFEKLFPIIMGVFVWGGLYLRNAQLRRLIPLHRGEDRS